MSIQTVFYASQGSSCDPGANISKSGWGQASASSPTRGIFAGRQNNDSYPDPANIYNNTIDYVDFASLGTCSDFGDLTVGRKYPGGASNSTRMLIVGGDKSPGTVANEIDYITMASTGNGTDFGDLSVARNMGFGHLATSTRAVFCGGNDGSLSNVMDYNTITSGNSSDFGDLTVQEQIRQMDLIHMEVSIMLIQEKFGIYERLENYNKVTLTIEMLQEVYGQVEVNQVVQIQLINLI